ncbi:hypothetical protein BHK98_03220 [Hornefia porci]|uniref:Uncharacterized protein n=1 Tax=Hornefia porci TaxID=2652292 RepID=A0A1Q9JG28_9FIRM|nr:hypothetical protein BHK98_03220 [Hornefia porci]
MFPTLKHKRKQHECTEAAAPTSDTPIVQTPGGGLFSQEAGKVRSRETRKPGESGYANAGSYRYIPVYSHAGKLDI